jgi:hypothetical protein
MSFELGGFRFKVLREGALGSLEEETESALRACARIFREERRIARFWVIAARAPGPGLLLAQPIEDGAWATDAMRELTRVHDATAIWSCAEVWMREAQSPEQIAQYRRGDLAKDPLAIEKAMVICESPHTNPPHTMYLASIDRAHGRPKLLAWKKTTRPDGHTEGTMAFLLPPSAYGRTGAA